MGGGGVGVLVVGKTENKATQPSLAGAWAELGKMPFKSQEKDPYHYHIWDFAYFFA